MDTFSVVAKLLAKSLDVDINDIKPTSNLAELGADSLTLIEIIFDLEDALHIKLGDERPTLIVVQDIVNHLDRYLNQKATP